MIHLCEQCNGKHQVNIDGIQGTRAKYKCNSCGHMNIIDVDNDAQLSEGANRESSASAGSDFSKVSGKSSISGISIKTRLILVVVVLLFFSLTVFSLIASLKGENALSSQAQNHLMTLTSQKAREYNSIFSSIQHEIEGIAQFAEITTSRSNLKDDLGFKILMPWNGSQYGGSPITEASHSEILALQRIGLALKGLIQNSPYIELGYMATNNNIMVLDDEKVVDIISKEKEYIPTVRPWYKEAMAKGKTIWTQPYIDVNTKKLIVSCATPVSNTSKTIQGVVGFDVMLETIKKDIISLDIGYDSQAFLLDKNGKYLVKPGMKDQGSAWNSAVVADSALDTDNTELKQIVNNMVTGKSGLGTYVDQGKNLFVSYVPLYAIQASIGIVISENEVMRPAVDIRNLIISVWGVLLVISVIIGWLIGNSITKPIKELTYKADLISQGQSDLSEISSKRKDEIGLLIESFNRLIISLKIAISRRKK